jgi:hypothetical protein
MTRWTVAALLVVVACGWTGCTRGRSPSQFSLPAGNVEAGKAAFVDLKCYTCHTVEGVELPAPASDRPTSSDGCRSELRCKSQCPVICTHRVGIATHKFVRGSAEVI